MLLTFSRLSFVYDIIKGRKTHTIREDKDNRWQENRKVHFWYMSPRHTKYGAQAFGTGTCRRVEPIEIIYHGTEMSITVAGKLLTPGEVQSLAYCDGFNSVEEFQEWFKESFTGKLIYWKDTDFIHL